MLSELFSRSAATLVYDKAEFVPLFRFQYPNYMKYEVEQIDPFRMIGISVVVDQSTAAEKIGALWRRWFAEGVANRIEGKASEDVFNCYTDYEGDHTKPYCCFLGCKVNSDAALPEGLEEIHSDGGKYAVFDVHGKLPEVVVETWMGIYHIDSFERRWDVDFDAYGLEAQNPDDAELKTFVSIK